MIQHHKSKHHKSKAYADQAMQFSRTYTDPRVRISTLEQFCIGVRWRLPVEKRGQKGTSVCWNNTSHITSKLPVLNSEIVICGKSFLSCHWCAEVCLKCEWRQHSSPLNFLFFKHSIVYENNRKNFFTVLCWYVLLLGLLILSSDHLRLHLVMHHLVNACLPTLCSCTGLETRIQQWASW